MFGCHGKMLRVDLSKSTVSQEDLDESIVKKFLGGSGVATKYLWDEVKKGADPLGPENELIFMTGPLTGTAGPSYGRYSVVAKSPLTGIWAQSNSAGFWGAHFKRTGFDGIIFQGISPKPVYLVVEEEKAELRDASNTWGKNVWETTTLIKEELGEKFDVACIGIAGENQVRYASIVNDLYRAAGRCGMGAVMGSKRVKAVAAYGTKPVKIANPADFATAVKNTYRLVDESMIKVMLETFGTHMMMDYVQVRGGLPTRNFQTGVFPNIDEIRSTALSDKVLVREKSCFSCPIKCVRETEIRTGKYKGHKGEGPEYQAVGSLGSMCSVDDFEAITMASYLCNDYGLDIISTGNTIGFAMECYEKGVLTDSDTGGLEIKFGDPDILIELVHRIAKREGIGDLLAEGVKRVSEKLGKGTERFAMHVKGLELTAYDPRAVPITGLSRVTSNRGGDHLGALVEAPTFIDIPILMVEESKIEDPFTANPKEAKVVKDLEDALAIFDAGGGCKFMGMSLSLEDCATLIRSATGWEYSVGDLRKIGERIYNLARAYSIREGLTKADDILPPRLLEEPLPEGPAEGHVCELVPLLDAYYELREWDKTTGKPTPEKLRKLDLEEVIPVIWD